MRFREFAPRKRNKDQQVNEILPAIAAVAGGTLARAAGGALARGAANLAGKAIQGIGNQAKALFTPKGFQKMMGKQAGGQAGAAAFKQNDPQQGDQNAPFEVKPGQQILHPGLGPVKIKTVGPEIELDTEKALGQNIKVKKAELQALLGQGQQQQDQK